CCCRRRGGLRGHVDDGRHQRAARTSAGRIRGRRGGRPAGNGLKHEHALTASPLSLSPIRFLLQLLTSPHLPCTAFVPRSFHSQLPTLFFLCDICCQCNL